MYDILNISDKYKVLYFNDKVKDSFMNMFLIGLDNSYLDIDMETLNNSSKYYRERLNKKFMNKFNKNFNLNNNRHLSYLSEVCGVDISIHNGDKKRETPRNNKKMLYFIKNDTGYGLVLKNNKKSYNTELLNTELPALEKLSIEGGTRSTEVKSLLERAIIGTLDGIINFKNNNNNDTLIQNFKKGFIELVNNEPQYNMRDFESELANLEEGDIKEIINNLIKDGVFNPKEIIEEAQKKREAQQAREKKRAREEQQAREEQKAQKEQRVRKKQRPPEAVQTSTQNPNVIMQETLNINTEETYQEGDGNFVSKFNLTINGIIFKSTINSINLLLKNDGSVNNLVVKIIQHAEFIKEMINHFIFKLLQYKDKKEIIMSENIRDKLEKFKNSKNPDIDIDYLYDLISRELTLLYISNGFDTLKDFKSITNITTEIYSYHPNLIWIEGLIALTVLYFSTFIIKYNYTNNTNNNEYIIYLHNNIETYMNNKYIYRFFQELVSSDGGTFKYLNKFLTAEGSNNTSYIGYLHENGFFKNIIFNNILENNNKADIKDSNKYNIIFNEMQQFFFNNIATLKGASIELDRVSDEMIFSLLKKDDKYNNNKQYENTTLLVNHDSNNKLEFNNLQLLNRAEESRIPYTLYHSKNYIFNNEHNYVSLSLLDKFFDSGNSSYDEISKIKNTRDIIIPKELSKDYNNDINEKTVKLLQDVVGIDIDSNEKYIYTYFSEIDDKEDGIFKVIIEGNGITNNNNINNINDIINVDYKSILNANTYTGKKLNICFKISDDMYVRLLSFKLVNGKVTIENYNTISILKSNITKITKYYSDKIIEIEKEKDENKIKSNEDKNKINMKNITEYTIQQNELDNEMTMKRNILVRLKYLGDYSQYYYAKILQDFIKINNNYKFYSWQEPQESIQERETNKKKTDYLELKTEYLLIILSTYALIEFNYGMNWYNSEDSLIKIQANNSYNYLKLNDNNNITSFKKKIINEVIKYYKTLYKDLNENLTNNEKYYKIIILYINYINFVYSGFIFKHSLYYETRYTAYKGHFNNNNNSHVVYMNNIYRNCKNFVEEGNFKFKVFKLYNEFTEFKDVRFFESNNPISEDEDPHFTSRMKQSVNKYLQNYKEAFINEIKDIVAIVETEDSDVNNKTYNINFENLFKLKLKNPLLSGIVDMLINLNHLDNIPMNTAESEPSSEDIEKLCKFLNNQFNNDTNNEYGTINNLFTEGYSDEFNNAYTNSNFTKVTIDNFSRITPINIYYLVYKFKLLINLEDNENSANPDELIFIIKKNIDKGKPHMENIKYITITKEHIKAVRFLMNKFINYQIINLFRGRTPIRFEKSKEQYLLFKNNEQNPTIFKKNYGKYYEELVNTFEKEGNYIENKLVNYEDSCKLDSPKDCVESIRLPEDMKYNLIRDVNNVDSGLKKTFRVVIDSIDNNLNTQAYLGGVAFTHKYSNNKFKIIDPLSDNNTVAIEITQNNEQQALQEAQKAQQAQQAQQAQLEQSQQRNGSRVIPAQQEAQQSQQKKRQRNTNNINQHKDKKRVVEQQPPQQPQQPQS